MCALLYEQAEGVSIRGRWSRERPLAKMAAVVVPAVIPAPVTADVYGELHF
jgi:hypothetical protein